MLTTRATGRSYAAASECGGYWRLEKWRQWRQRNIAKVKNVKMKIVKIAQKMEKHGSFSRIKR
ncbi:hypothetical protein CG392_04995, partial [Gardnerella vaginalis]